MYYAVLGAGIALAVAFIIVRARRADIPAFLLKSMASLFFIFCAVAAVYETGAKAYPYGGLVICGLVCGLLGDVYLGQKWLYRQHGDICLYWGFFWFGVGHLFFIASMLRHFETGGPHILAALASALLAALAVFFSGGLTGLKMGKFRPVCSVYIFVIFLSAGIAFGAFFKDSAQSAALVMGIGSMFFIISDLILSFSYFKKSSALLAVASHTAYYAAQFIIASSILFF